MSLTAKDVREVQFGVTHVRAGYDMAEVDAFLARVEAAMTALQAEQEHAAAHEAVLRTEIARLQARVDFLERQAGQP